LGSPSRRRSREPVLPPPSPTAEGPESLKESVEHLSPTINAGTRDQAASADIVLIAVNWSKLPAAVAGLPIVIDANNPIEAPLFKPVDLQGRVSSHVVADLVSGARLVKAFNHLRAEVLASNPRADGGRRVLFYSGDDNTATAEVGALIDRIGFAGIDLGPLSLGGRLMQFPGGPLPTAEWVLEALCVEFPDEPVALYAGGSASFVQRGTAAREQIKASIQRGDVRLVCATDAACEGLNLQRLGAQVNVDLPWNPSRLEQRKGRVQHIGQIRDNVHVLNLRYAGTVEDQVYAALSDRFGDIFSVLGRSRTASRTTGSTPFLVTGRLSRTSHSALSWCARPWNCATSGKSPTIRASTGSTPSASCHRVT
jgi:predicted dinucleotide-binding enzyme